MSLLGSRLTVRLSSIYSPEILSTPEDAEAIYEVSDVFLSFGIREALFTMVFVPCSRTLFSDALPTWNVLILPLLPICHIIKTTSYFSVPQAD